MLDGWGRVGLAWTMTNANDDLDAVYGLKTPGDNRRHYDGWAKNYDSQFVSDMDYRLPGRVARAFVDAGPDGPVLDLGAGTGLVGEALKGYGIGPVDGTDISPGMLAQAEAKRVYRHLFEGDILGRLPVADGAYASAVSAGTFTNGHVGPDGLNEVLRVVRPGGVIVLSVNGVHWENAGFAAKLEGFGDASTGLTLDEVRYYGDAAAGSHANDHGWIVRFWRGG